MYLGDYNCLQFTVFCNLLAKGKNSPWNKGHVTQLDDDDHWKLDSTQAINTQQIYYCISFIADSGDQAIKTEHRHEERERTKRRICILI